MDRTTEDDRELLGAWRRGDLDAGNELCQRHFLSIYTFFRTKVDDGHRDLVQLTFLGCVESRDRVPQNIPFRAYLLGIAHKQLLRRLRKTERERRAMRREADAGPDSVQSPSKIIAARREQQLLLRGLRSLPLELQIVVELYYWEELRVAEIATITDVAPGTVKSRLARARESLHDFIRAAAEDQDLARSTLNGLDRWAASLRNVMADSAPDQGELGPRKAKP